MHPSSRAFAACRSDGRNTLNLHADADAERSKASGWFSSWTNYVQTILLDLTLRMSNVTFKLMNPQGELTLTIQSALLASLADGWQVLKQVLPCCAPLVDCLSGRCSSRCCPAALLWSHV